MSAQRGCRFDCSPSLPTGSPERALATLRSIQRHEVYLDDALHHGVSTVSEEQATLLSVPGEPELTGTMRLALL